jgi:hypothetical protein
MLEFEATTMQELRAEIVAYLRHQMRSNLAQKSTTENKALHNLIDARAFALGTAADALESATLKAGA